MRYYPQKSAGENYTRKYNATDNKFTVGSLSSKRGGVSNIDYFGDGVPRNYEGRFPTNLLEYGEETSDHPTQKPIALMEYLIRTYTNEGDTVLDFTMGSGTTGVAAMNTGRRFVGVELDPAYFAIAQERIANAAGEFVTTAKEVAQGKRLLFDWSAD
jgi:DNA modification methylase